MKQIWERFRSVTSFEQADDAIDSEYSFAENFRHFAVRNLNTEFAPGDPLPRDKRYVSLDPEQFPDRKEPPYLTGELVADEEYARAMDIPNLAARYLRLSATDPRIKKVTLDLTGLEPAALVNVMALVQTTDGWVSQPLDLSGERKVLFCFDKGPSTPSVRGSFEEILLVVANSAPRRDGRVTGSLKLQPKSRPCAPVWEGTATVSRQQTDTLMTTTSTLTANAVFEFDDEAEASQGGVPYRVRRGTYTYDSLLNITGRNPPCRTIERSSGQMLPLRPPNPTAIGYTSGQLEIFNTGGPAALYVGGAGTNLMLTQTSNCNDLGEDEISESPSILPWLVVEQPQEVSADGNTLQGSFERPDGMGGTFRFEWRFERKTEE